MTHKVIHLSLCLIVLAFSFFVFPPYSQAQDVFVRIGSGEGTPGSQGNSITVSLENTVALRGLQLAILDENDYLSATGCSTTGRASTLTCDINEKQYGWTILQLYSFGGDLIEPGSGPILSINYAVKGYAPPEECSTLRVLKKAREIESKASDGNKIPLSVRSAPGQFCFIGGTDEEDEDTTTTTTTSSDTTDSDIEEPESDTASNQVTAISNLGSDTNKSSSSGGASQQTYGRPRRTTSVTTTSIDTSDRQASARKTIPRRQGSTGTEPDGTTSVDSVGGSSRTRVIVSPDSVTLTSGDLITLDPQTIKDGIKVDGDYIYQLNPPSLIGSKIDDEGLFTAGTNTSPNNIEETIQITDTANKNARALILFIVEGRKPSSGKCELSISPSSATIGSGKSLQLTPHNSEECKEGVYEWKVNSKIGSSINDQGFYKAATNTNLTPALDIVMVTDTVNQLSTDVIISVSPSTVAIPDVSEGSSDAHNLEPAGIAGRKTSPNILILLTLFIIAVGFLAIRKFKH